MESHTLAVRGATLYFEVRGRGPVVLLIPGGPADAGTCDALAAPLSERYTVVACDPRGNSRSKLEGPPGPIAPTTFADDAAAILDAVKAPAAHVFGSSGGAQIGLALAARHPGRVRVLVAHEPPCVRLLDEGEALAAEMRRIGELAHADLPAAMGAFGRLAGLGGPPPDPAALPPEARATMARIGGNLPLFFRHVAEPLATYAPDLEALHGRHVVVGVGGESGDSLPARTARALAARLGVTPVLFPGDHGGHGPHAAAFARLLDAEIQGRDPG